MSKTQHLPAMLPERDVDASHGPIFQPVRLRGIDGLPLWLCTVTTVQQAGPPFPGMAQNSLAAHPLPSYVVITAWIGLERTVTTLVNARMVSLAAELVVNFIGPWAVFESLDGRVSDTHALIASALPPLIWSVIELARSRRVDALSAIVLLGILLTLLATLFGGSPRLLQVRENAVTGLIGVAFLATLCLKRPLIYHLACATFGRQSPEAAFRLEALAATAKGLAFFRRLTVFWGIGLMAQTAVLVWLAFVWPIGRFLLLSPVIGYGLLGLLMLGTLWYRRRLNLI